jgi:hypothetical protein
MARRIGRKWRPIIKRAAELVEAETNRVGVPPTLRRLHYLLLGDEKATAARYDNTEGAYNYLSEKTARMRDEGTFPALVDRTRHVEWMPWTEKDPATILRNAADEHRVYRWRYQLNALVLVVEKDGLVPVLEQAFYELGLPISALRGHTSQSHLADLRRIVDDLVDIHGEVVVLYAGDYDPSGLHIPQDFERRLDRPEVEVRRVALDRDQVEEHELRSVPAKVEDSRSAAMIEAEGEAVQVELDALDPLVLVQLYADAISELGSPYTWWEQIEREVEEADAIRAAADRLDGAA